MLKHETGMTTTNLTYAICPQGSHRSYVTPSLVELPLYQSRFWYCSLNVSYSMTLKRKLVLPMNKHLVASSKDSSMSIPAGVMMFSRFRMLRLQHAQPLGLSLYHLISLFTDVTAIRDKVVVPSSPVDSLIRVDAIERGFEDVFFPKIVLIRSEILVAGADDSVGKVNHVALVLTRAAVKNLAIEL